MVMCNLRLQHEVSLLQQQLCESRELIHSLQSELQVYDRMCSNTKANKGQRMLFVYALSFLITVTSIELCTLLPPGGGSGGYSKQNDFHFYCCLTVSPSNATHNKHRNKDRSMQV